MKIALSIAGLDPSAGAGILADIKTFSSLGIYGTSVITAITIQNTKGVEGIWPVPSMVLRQELECLLRDFSFSGVKLGMLYTPENVEVVSEVIKEYNLPNIVLDPIIASSSGRALLKEDALDKIKEKLLPLVDVITPNLLEASVLWGKEIRDIVDMERAAQSIYEFGVKGVVITGGHLKGKEVMDVFFDGVKCHRFSSVREERDPHGTGCVFSSALLALRCREVQWLEAIERAKSFVCRAISKSFKPAQGAFVLC